MDKADMLARIADGRTDLVFDLLKLADWRAALNEGAVKAAQWFVYYNDTTALKAILNGGGDLSSISLDDELGNACFFGHWKVADFLIAQGANPRAVISDAGETPLHNALSKAGRPAHNYVVRLLLEHGADPNAATIANVETGAFMRDVRTKGETPLHRAAAFADAEAIELLLAHGADKTIKDAAGDTPLSWASWHLRPGRILQLLTHGPHRITDKHVAANTSDHGAGWGNGMDRNILGAYLRES